MSRQSFWAVRTVRNGSVKIGGKTYRAVEHHKTYDGRLDGHRFAFGRYLKPSGEWETFVSLWGTEEAFRNPPVNCGEGPHLVDGGYPWEWWNA